MITDLVALMLRDRTLGDKFSELTFAINKHESQPASQTLEENREYEAKVIELRTRRLEVLDELLKLRTS